jgi:hypothetical protein
MGQVMKTPQTNETTPRVMVDACVTQHAIRFQSGCEDKSVTWGKQKFTVRLARRVKKRLPAGEWLQQEVPFLPAVAAAAREGKITLCRGGELGWEANHPKPVFFEGPASPFQGLSFEPVKPPFYYSRTLGSFDDGPGEGHARQKAFFENIQYPRYLEILKAIGGNKHADAFHLWAAESDHVDYFLTTDRKLIHSVQGPPIAIGVCVLAPSKLLEDIGGSYDDLADHFDHLKSEPKG